MNNQGVSNPTMSSEGVNLGMSAGISGGMGAGMSAGMGDVVGLGVVSSTRRTSRVWRYFGMVDNCHYICRLCSFVGAYTNTTNMRKHIQHHHPERFQDILDHTRPTTRPFYPNVVPRMRPPQQYQTAQAQAYPSSIMYPYMAPPKRTAMPKLPDVGFMQSSGTNSEVMLSPPASTAQPQQSQPTSSTTVQLSSSVAFTSAATTPTTSHYTPTPPTAAVAACELSPEESKVINQFFPPLAEGTECSSDSDNTSRGASGTEERANDEFHNNGEDVAVPLSPEQFLSEASEREPTPAPPAPTPPKPESYQLRHNNHLNIVLEALARDEAFMDVTLTAQGRSLKAHKSVLSAVSPYFRGVLRDNPCQHPIIIMPRDVRFEELYSIVNYIYKGEMTVAAEDLTSLLKTAEILQVSGLAPSDSSATVNPADPTNGVNVRSSSASSASSSSTHPSGSRPGRSAKTSAPDTPTPPVRPKSRENTINPSDFMDVDMTCVKEEIPSGEEDDEEDETSIRAASEEERKESVQREDSLKTSVTVGADDSPGASSNQTSEQISPDAIKTEPSPDVTPDDPTPFTCPHCNEVHRGFEPLNSHLRLKHPSKPSFTCRCARVFIRQAQYQAHTRVCSSVL